MSSFYLVVVLGFLAVFFWEDQKEWRHFSKVLWIPLIWLIISTTRLVPILFPTGGYSGGPGLPSIEKANEGNPTFQLIYGVLMLAAIAALIRRRNVLSTFWRANSGIYMLYGYMLFSFLWTVFPEVSLRRYIKMCGCLLIAILVSSEKEHHKAFEHIFRRYAAVCLVLSLFFVKTNRTVSYVIAAHGDHIMAGIAYHKNDLGILALFSLVFLAVRAIRLWPVINYLDAALILHGAYFLIRAHCTTAIVLTFLGMAIIIGLKLAGSFRKIVVLVVISLIVTLPIFLITLNSPGSAIAGAFFSTTGKDATLTGRIPMWQDLIRIGRKNIVLGSGYEGYWSRNYQEIWARWTALPIQAHNGFIEISLNLGLVGLFIILLIISRLMSLLSSQRSLSQPNGHWYLTFLILFIINNVTESLFINMSLSWNLFLMVMTNAEKDRLICEPNLTHSQ